MNSSCALPEKKKKTFKDAGLENFDPALSAPGTGKATGASDFAGFGVTNDNQANPFNLQDTPAVMDWGF